MSEEYCKDELEAPKWMDEKFFGKVFAKFQNNDVEIKSVKITPGSKAGEHYASLVFRALVNYQTSGKSMEKSLIVKTMPFVEGEKMETLRKLKIFETEITMYHQVIPIFEEILRKSGDNTVFSGKCLYSSLDPVKVLVFEDLKTLGYETLDGWGAPDEEAKLALVKLAKWHAIGHKLFFEHDERFASLNEGLLNSNIVDMPMVIDGIENFCDLLKTLEGFEYYAEKFEKYRNLVLINNCKKLTKSKEEGNPCKIFVLNHGDFHAKNLMFRKDPKDAILLDFQICNWTPSALDVIYFLYLLLSPESRMKKRDEFLRFYYQHFAETLDLIQFKGYKPTFDDLLEDINKCREFELLLFTTFLPCILHGISLEREGKKMQTDEIVESAEFRAQVYKTPMYLEEVKIGLPAFEAMNINYY